MRAVVYQPHLHIRLKHTVRNRHARAELANGFLIERNRRFGTRRADIAWAAAFARVGQKRKLRNEQDGWVATSLWGKFQ